MNLAALLAKRDADGTPVRVALIGAGKFGTMILSQLRLMRGVQLAVLADLDVERAWGAALRCGWPAERFELVSDLGSANDTIRSGKTALVDFGTLAAQCEVDLVIEATGHEEAGARHAFAAIDAGHHVIMVTVEADVVVGPYLHELARRRGVIYSMAYGDQPAIICELVDWARTCGFRVVAAGKGTKYLSKYRRSTPQTAFDYYGFTPDQIATGGFNPKMFNSFLDGTKSAIEMVAVANATGLRVPEDGLSFAAVPSDKLAAYFAGANGIADVVSCMDPDGHFVENHLRWGVYVVFTSDEPYSVRCFDEYGLPTDPSGRYAAMWRPYHLIGLEVGVSIASIACRGEATGAPSYGPQAEVVCATRAPMHAGDIIDGEGGYAVYGTIVSAERARAERLVPMGLANGCRLTRDVGIDHPIREDDVAIDESALVWKLRREQDAFFRAAVGV